MPWYDEAVRAPRANQPRRHGAAKRPTPAGPSVRTAVIAGAAAAGAVATGTFTAFVPAAGSSAMTPTASADEGPVVASLAANTVRLDTSQGPNVSNAAFFSPVDFSGGNGAGSGDGSGFDQADQHLAMLGKAADIAAQIAKQHAEEVQIDQTVQAGGLNGWIAQALRILGMPQSLSPSVKKIIMSESGGNPNAINRWDANARAGTPSQGLMQTIPSTFNHYVHPDLANRPITDPVANITAGIRYMIDNYGMQTLQAGGRTNSAGGYVGY